MKKITSLFLALLLLFQCMPLTYAVDPQIDANAGGGGSGTSKTGGGSYTWDDSYQGIRFTLLSNTGVRISDSVDILWVKIPSGAKKLLGNKFESNSEGTPKWMLWTDIPDLGISNTGAVPRPLRYQNYTDWSGNGVQVREYFMAGVEETLRTTVAKYNGNYYKIPSTKSTNSTSNGAKTNSTNTNSSKQTSTNYSITNLPKDDLALRASIISDYAAEERSHLTNNIISYAKNSSSYDTWVDKVEKIIMGFEQGVSYLDHLTSSEISIIKTRVKSAWDNITDKKKYYNSLNPSGELLAPFNNSPFMIAYADDSDFGNGLFQIAYADDNENAKILNILNSGLFTINDNQVEIAFSSMHDGLELKKGDKLSASELHSKIKSANVGNQDILFTVWYSGGYVLAEPITWVKPWNYGSGNTWIYGTITNLAKFCKAQMGGTIKDYNTTMKGFGGAMVLDKDVNLTGVGNGGVISGSGLGAQPSYNEIANLSLGYGMHLYSFNDLIKPTGTHTWDSNTYPDGTPGPAPEEWTPDVGSTGTVINKPNSRIVKVYEVKDEETQEIKHIETFERINTVPLIRVEDEPQYKLIEWQYGTPNNPVNSKTEWDEAIKNVPKDHHGTEETTVNIVEGLSENAETTLYVRLRKTIPIPTTNTWDNDNYPGGDPGPAPDPTKDPEEPVDPSNPNLKYRIIKVYEELERGRPESEIETISTLLREPTIPRIHIDDEPQYKLIEWKYGIPNNPVTSPTEPWAEVTSGVSNTHRGTSETTVNLLDPSNPGQVVTLYVRLRKTVIPPPEPVNEDLTESQLIKISNSNSATFGWDSNVFTAGIAAARTSHSFTMHVGPCGGCGDPPGSDCTDHCGDYTSTHSMSRSKGDPIVSATFAILTKDNHETTVATPSAHSDFAGKTWGKETVVADSIKYEQTIGDSSYNWSLVSDGSSKDGVEYITTISRASIKDIANIALYKKDAMSRDSYDRVKTVFPEANTSQNTRKGNGTYSSKLSYVFGHSVFDNSSTSSCGLDSPDHHGSRTQYDDIKFVVYNTQKFNLDGNFNIYVYGGKKTKDANATSTIQPTGFTVVHGSNATNITSNGEPKTALYHSQQTATIKFFPYVRMSYMTTLDNKGFTNYSSFAGYTKDPSQPNSRTVYVLSTKQSTITPTNAVEVSWDNQAQMSGKYGLQMTSQQWSTHASATSGKDWRQKTQVLPGGALYQLKTNNTESTIKTVTYNTLVEDSSRTWISVSDNNKYTIPSIIKSTQDYLTEAENVIENYRIVQWVNKDWSVSNAWDNASSQAVKIKNGGESLSNLGMSTTASTDSKYLLINGTSKDDNVAEADIDIIRKNYATKVCKGFTDTDGNVYIAYVVIEGSQEKLSESSLNTAVNYLKSVCGTAKTPKTTLPSNMTYTQIAIGKKQDTTDTILNNLKICNNELYQMELKTGWVSNLINSVERNTGNDKNATWLSVKDGKWYNEAFDGYYMVMQQAYYKVGINIPKVRQSVLDPKLCPVKNSTSDIFSKAYLSQFRLDEKSTVATDKVDGYLATFEDMTVVIPSLPLMFISRPFYIPNANVQDLT